MSTSPSNRASDSTKPGGGALRGGVAGLLSGAAGLASAELLAGVVHGLTSPVIGVGNQVVDHVPVALKQFAIRQFGTHDKQALLIGIGATIAALAVVLGVAAARRRWIGVVGLAAFGAFGAVASATGRTGNARDVWPSLVAGVVAVIVLLALLGSPRRRVIGDDEGVLETSPGLEARPAPVGPGLEARPALKGPAPEARPELVGPSIGRRAFLGRVAVTAAAAATVGTVGRRLQRSVSAIGERARVVLPSARRKLPPVPANVAVAELAKATPFMTPNASFYRIDTALLVPRVDVSTWKLDVKGMVMTATSYTYAQLLARDLIERDITLTCVSNEVGGVLMGNARWLGVPLRELLDEAGIDPKATQIVGRSVDRWTSGFPTAVALDGRDAMVALAMNGEPLPFAHGFPARLIVPGLYGYVSATKWLTAIECTTLEVFNAYWVPRGYAKEAPIKLASRIDVPRGLTTIAPGRVAIAGIAWAQRHGIEKVEIRVDNGPWETVELAHEQSVDTWRQWRHVWDATPGQHEIAVRATDHLGHLQIEKRTAPLPNGATGWHSIVVFVKA